MPQLFQLIPGFLKQFNIIIKCSILFFTAKPANTRVYSRHQNIRRTACLKNMQIFFYLLSVRKYTIHVDQRCLCQSRKRFVDTVNYNIRALYIRVFRKIRMKSKVRPMRFIHNQRNPISMYDFRNPRHVRNNTVIGRRCDHNRPDFLLFRTNSCFLFRINSFLHFRISPLLPFRISSLPFFSNNPLFL